LATFVSASTLQSLKTEKKERRADYTIIGDNVNTASRLCSEAKGGQIIISDSIYQKVKDRIIADEPYQLTVKGKNLVLRVYLLKDLKGGII
jgi:adenylate cyclase